MRNTLTERRVELRNARHDVKLFSNRIAALEAERIKDAEIEAKLRSEVEQLIEERNKYRTLYKQYDEHSMMLEFLVKNLAGQLKRIHNP